jgi:hypothetical protein
VRARAPKSLKSQALTLAPNAGRGARKGSPGRGRGGDDSAARWRGRAGAATAAVVVGCGARHGGRSGDSDVRASVGAAGLEPARVEGCGPGHLLHGGVRQRGRPIHVEQHRANPARRRRDRARAPTRRLPMYVRSYSQGHFRLLSCRLGVRIV